MRREDYWSRRFLSCLVTAQWGRGSPRARSGFHVYFFGLVFTALAYKDGLGS